MKNSKNGIYRQNQGDFPTISVELPHNMTHFSAQNEADGMTKQQKQAAVKAQNTHLLMQKTRYKRKEITRFCLLNHATNSLTTTYRTSRKTREFEANHKVDWLHARYKAPFVRLIQN